MSEKGILQLVQTDFTRFENYQTRLQGSYKLCLCDVSVEKASGSADIAFAVEIEQLRGVLDNRTQLQFVYSDRGSEILSNKLQFPEVFINGQFFFSGLNMGTISKLILTFEYEKC